MPRADPSPVCAAGEHAGRSGGSRDPSSVAGDRSTRAVPPAQTDVSTHSQPGTPGLRTRLPALPGSCAREARGYAEEKPSPTSVIPKSVITPKLCPDPPGTGTPQASRASLSPEEEKGDFCPGLAPLPTTRPPTASPPGDRPHG